jgi:hypothetical protein
MLDIGREESPREILTESHCAKSLGIALGGLCQCPPLLVSNRRFLTGCPRKHLCQQRDNDQEQSAADRDPAQHRMKHEDERHVDGQPGHVENCHWALS